MCAIPRKRQEIQLGLARDQYRETGFAELNGDLPEADFWPETDLRFAWHSILNEWIGLFLTVDSPVRYLRDIYVHSEDIAYDRLVRAPRPTRDRR